MNDVHADGSIRVDIRVEDVRREAHAGRLGGVVLAEDDVERKGSACQQQGRG